MSNVKPNAVLVTVSSSSSNSTTCNKSLISSSTNLHTTNNPVREVTPLISPVSSALATTSSSSTGVKRSASQANMSSVDIGTFSSTNHAKNIKLTPSSSTTMAETTSIQTQSKPQHSNETAGGNNPSSTSSSSSTDKKSNSSIPVPIPSSTLDVTMPTATNNTTASSSLNKNNSPMVQQKPVSSIPGSNLVELHKPKPAGAAASSSNPQILSEKATAPAATINGVTSNSSLTTPQQYPSNNSNQCQQQQQHTVLAPLNRKNKNLSEKKIRRLEKNRLSARNCRRKKREFTQNLQHEINILEGENLRLRLQLQIGQEAEQLSKDEQHRVVTEGLDSLLKSGASDSEIYLSIEEFKEKYADYGRDRRSAIDFHLRNVERLLMPTTTTTIAMRALDGGDGGGSSSSSSSSISGAVGNMVGSTTNSVPCHSSAGKQDSNSKVEDTATSSMNVVKDNVIGATEKDSIIRKQILKSSNLSAEATSIDTTTQDKQSAMPPTSSNPSAEGTCTDSTTQDKQSSMQPTSSNPSAECACTDSTTQDKQSAMPPTSSNPSAEGTRTDSTTQDKQSTMPLTSSNPSAEGTCTDSIAQDKQSAMPPKSLFHYLVKYLQVTPHQAAALKDSRHVAKELDSALAQSLKMLQELRERLAQCTDDLDAEFTQIRSILTPRQAAKFLVWVANNGACMHMLNELWSRQYPEPIIEGDESKEIIVSGDVASDEKSNSEPTKSDSDYSPK